MNELTYKGYTVKVYGKSSLSIFDSDGKEVLHTGSRGQKHFTENDLKNVIEDYFLIREITENMKQKHKAKNGVRLLDWEDSENEQ